MNDRIIDASLGSRTSRMMPLTLQDIGFEPAGSLRHTMAPSHISKRRYSPRTSTVGSPERSSSAKEPIPRCLFPLGYESMATPTHSLHWKRERAPPFNNVADPAVLGAVVPKHGRGVSFLSKEALHHYVDCRVCFVLEDPWVSSIDLAMRLGASNEQAVRVISIIMPRRVERIERELLQIVKNFDPILAIRVKTPKLLAAIHPNYLLPAPNTKEEKDQACSRYSPEGKAAQIPNPCPERTDVIIPETTELAGLAPPTLVSSNTALIIRRQEQELGPARDEGGGRSDMASGSSGFKPTTRDSGGGEKRAGRKRTGRGDDTNDNTPSGNGDRNGDGGSETRHRKRAKGVGQRFACPYHKHNPVPFKRACLGPGGFESFSRVKDHVKRNHQQTPLCTRCQKVFSDEASLKMHQREEVPCPWSESVVVRNPMDGYDSDQWEKLGRRVCNKSEVDKWLDMYRILFKREGVESRFLPSPYHEENEELIWKASASLRENLSHNTEIDESLDEVARNRDDPEAYAAAKERLRNRVANFYDDTMRGISLNSRARQQGQTALAVPSVDISASTTGTVSFESRSEVGQTPATSHDMGISSSSSALMESDPREAIPDLDTNAAPMTLQRGAVNMPEDIAHFQLGLEEPLGTDNTCADRTSVERVGGLESGLETSNVPGSEVLPSFVGAGGYNDNERVEDVDDLILQYLPRSFNV